MIATLVAHSLRRRRGFLATTVVVMCGFQFFVILAARSIFRSGGFQQLQTMMPSSLAKMMTASFQGLVLFGYSHPLVELFLMAVAISIGTELAAEIESKFVDLLMARPLRRTVVVGRSLAVLLVATLLAVGSMMTGTALGLHFLAPEGTELPPARVVVSLAANLTLLVLAWGGIALMFASFARRRATAAAVCGFLAFSMFVLDWVGRLWETVRPLSRLSPFHYFSPFAMIGGQPLERADVAALAGIFIATSAVAAMIYARRDL
ncbi:MAG TPA: ABC transporter permease subunit [Thermoanaerobaculia bacterium]|nr:ABC transporter permease subunit [Thermoanaerobaculia bacterium]